MIPGNANPLLLATAADGAAAAAAGPIKSLRFNSGDTANLTRTFTNTEQKKYTVSFWIKRTVLGVAQRIYSTNANSYIMFDSNNYLHGNSRGTGSTNAFWYSTRIFRDVGAWYHIVVAYDMSQAAFADKLKVYVNGELETLTGSLLDINQHSGGTHYIGTRAAATMYLDGYLADFYYIGGSQLDATSFGAFDSSGVWQAAEYDGTFGTNGAHLLDFASESTVGHDSSGNENDFTANNISTSAGAGNDVLFDVPTNGTQSDTGAGGEVSGNYCTWNIVDGFTKPTLSNGNLDFTNSGQLRSENLLGTVGFPVSGKYYFEVTITSYPSASTGSLRVGIARNGGVGTTDVLVYNATGNFQTFGADDSTPPTYGNGDVIGVAVDIDSTTVYFYKNGSLQGSKTFSSSDQFFPFFRLFKNSNSDTISGFANFGARAYTHAAPSGYTSLNTANFPTPTIADGSDYFDIKLYTGNGSTQTISGLGFSPDWVWTKARSFAENNNVFDTVRGVTKLILPDQTTAEQTISGITAFTSDGYTLGSHLSCNQNNSTYVSWNWDAGSSTASNTDGGITSSCRTSTSSGFSIVSWTGNGSSNQTVGHNLGVVPELIIAKNRDTTNSWAVWTTGFNANEYLLLNSTSAKATFSGQWGSTPTSSVFGVNDSSVNGSGNDIIAYCFSSVSSFSQIGQYTGNASTDGPFVALSFRPAWIMYKNISAAHSWVIFDSTRDTYNVSDSYLLANSSATEANASTIDFLSNGFKIRSSAASPNGSGNSILYLAFAENPFQANGGLAR